MKPLQCHLIIRLGIFAIYFDVMSCALRLCYHVAKHAQLHQRVLIYEPQCKRLSWTFPHLDHNVEVWAGQIAAIDFLLPLIEGLQKLIVVGLFYLSFNNCFILTCTHLFETTPFQLVLISKTINCIISSYPRCLWSVSSGQLGHWACASWFC